MPRARAYKAAHECRDPASFRSKWRERCIILPEGLVEQLFLWHGGQSSALYALASAGMRDLVSLSMIDSAFREVDRSIGKFRGKDRKSVDDLRFALETVRLHWKEYSAEEAGMDVEKYEYDRADYGLTAKVEDEIDVRSV